MYPPSSRTQTTHSISRQKPRRRLLAAAAAALALAAAACGSDSNDSIADDAASGDVTQDTTGATEPPGTEAPAEQTEPPADSSPEVFTRDSGLTVTVQETELVTVHSLTAPEGVFANSTHIFETDDSLVLVDTQFLLPNALDMRAYADELGKPIDRMFITHAHPDHFLGSEAFADVDLYALPDVAEEIAEIGDAEVAEKQADFGAAIASSFVTPEVVEPGTIEIDGVDFELSEVLDAEAHDQLVIAVPSAGTIAVGDIVYSGVHLIMAGAPDTWTTALTDLQATSDDYPIVLAGHGLPTTPAAYDANIAWLAEASELLAAGADFETFKSGLIEAFPDRGMDAAIDFVLPFLFPDEAPPADDGGAADEQAAAAEVTFGECEELALGSTVPLDALQAQLPDGVNALSLTDQGTVFDGSDDLGVLIIRTLRCDDITVAAAGGDEVSDGRFIAHVGTPVDASTFPATPYSKDGNNDADFNNHVFGFYSDSQAYVDAMDAAGIVGGGLADISVDDTEVGDCVVSRSISVDAEAFGFDVSGEIPDATCSEPDTPYIVNWWTVDDAGTAVLSQEIPSQVALVIDPTETVVTVTPTGELLQQVVGTDPFVVDAFGVVGLIPATDDPSMTITALG